ncbi:hypothetical protein GGU10DRAFT_368209 [Lentinula aff. detonsa]|uniref:DUF6534 domain-containing protein n=1 Tax=Lentinula aff. detonsa TaxID=2804958 RepID=A0AA38K7X5_9AGAR|nr:hypothetical protein GGU10DRAFT_368209 [Lentinula aff. detonsa]
MAYDATLGALEIGVLVAGVLFGVITAQVYIHHKSFPRESLWIKHGLVDFMWIIELGHTICVFHAIYFYTVTRFGDADALAVLPASIGAAVVLHGIVLLIVQGFFTYRIALFSGKPYIVPVLSGILIFCQMLAVYVLSAQLITVATKSLREFMDKWEWLMFTVLILRAIADVLISGSLVYHLVRCRHGTFKSTVAVVDKLILWSIETGIVTSMLGFLSIILYLTLKTTYAWLALLMFIPKVFSNAMLANMNSRVELQNMSRSVVDSTGVFTTGAFAAVPFGPVSVSADTSEIRSDVEDSSNEIYWASTMEQGADHKLPELTASGESSESGTVDK